jgi:hypothetical protein
MTTANFKQICSFPEKFNCRQCLAEYFLSRYVSNIFTLLYIFIFFFNYLISFITSLLTQEEGITTTLHWHHLTHTGTGKVNWRMDNPIWFSAILTALFYVLIFLRNNRPVFAIDVFRRSVLIGHFNSLLSFLRWYEAYIVYTPLVPR